MAAAQHDAFAKAKFMLSSKNFYLVLVFLLSASVSFSQKNEGTISGVVRSEKNSEVPGVTVTLRNTAFGTFTDSNGAFMFTSVPAGTFEIVFTSVGFETRSQQIIVKPNENIHSQENEHQILQ